MTLVQLNAQVTVSIIIPKQVEPLTEDMFAIELIDPSGTRQIVLDTDLMIPSFVPPTTSTDGGFDLVITPTALGVTKINVLIDDAENNKIFSTIGTVRLRAVELLNTITHRLAQ